MAIFSTLPRMVIMALLVVVATAGCGRKGPPVPPGEDEPEIRRNL